MDRFTAIWVYLAERPLLWLTVTVTVYWLAECAFRRTREFPLLNPVLVSILAIGGVLLATDTDYGTYFDGAQFVHFLLGPATVALAVPLTRQRARLRRHWRALLTALIAGSLSAVVSVIALGWLFGLTRESILSMAPKSVTTPIAMAVANRVGGLPSLTAVMVILTGILGAVAAIPLLRWLRVRDAVSVGFALGVATHGIGTARAFRHSDEAGAFSGLGMGLNGVLTAILVPLVVWICGL